LTNLTIKVEYPVLLQADWRARREGTSLNAVLEAYLAEYAGATLTPRQRRLPRPIRPRELYEEAKRLHRGNG
jgi:hypothetical protein